MKEYIFPCVIIRTKETELLTREDFLKLSEQKNIRDILKAIKNNGYGEAEDITDPRDFERILRDNMEETYELIYSVVSGESDLDFFKLPSDYHNLKTILKAEFSGQDSKELLVRSGTVEPEVLIDYVRKREMSMLPPEMGEAVLDAIELFGKTGDPQEIDIRLDRACYMQMLESAEESGSDFLLEYARYTVDLINISTFIRLRETGRPKTFFDRVFLEGGNILQPDIEPIAIEIAGAVTVSGLEKYMDDRKMEYVREAFYVPFGFEPIVGFIQAKETEWKNLRLILAGKLAGLPDDMIRERLRATYV